MLYMLWDLGLKVGHATRTVDQCLKLARADITIRTALLDARFDPRRRAALRRAERRFQREVVQGTARRVRRGQAGRARRAPRRAGESRYLRRAQHQGRQGRPARPPHAVLARQVSLRDGISAELRRSRRSSPPTNTPPSAAARTSCGRCAATCISSPAGRGAADLRRAAGHGRAAGLCRPRAACARVERFMKHYFLVAKDVGDLTPSSASALEIEQVKPLAGLDRSCSTRLSWRTRRQIRATQRFPSSTTAGSTSPTPTSSSAIPSTSSASCQGRADGCLLPSQRRHGCCAGRCASSTTSCATTRRPTHLPRDALLGPRTRRPTLRRMNEAGVLGRFIPEFGKIVVDDAVQHVPPLHGGRASDPRRRRDLRHRARRRGRGASAVDHDLQHHPEPATRSTWPRSCTTSPRAAPRTIRWPARASRASSARAWA